jgi:hypothetical protein
MWDDNIRMDLEEQEFMSHSIDVRHKLNVNLPPC